MEVIIDSGDDVTHIAPIWDGFVLGSINLHFHIAVRKVIQFMDQMLREKGEKK